MTSAANLVSLTESLSAIAAEKLLVRIKFHIVASGAAILPAWPVASTYVVGSYVDYRADRFLDEYSCRINDPRTINGAHDGPSYWKKLDHTAFPCDYFGPPPTLNRQVAEWREKMPLWLEDQPVVATRLEQNQWVQVSPSSSEVLIILAELHAKLAIGKAPSTYLARLSQLRVELLTAGSAGK